MHVKKPKLAVVCNELVTVRAITDAVAPRFELALAHDSKSLKAIIASNPELTAIMVDIAALQVDAIKLLEAVRSESPDARRILLTDFCDLRMIVEGLHTGMIQRIVYKPIYGPELLGAIGVHAAPAAFMNANQQQHIRAAI
jgi:DNA-binding NtrC family response regulator